MSDRSVMQSWEAGESRFGYVLGSDQVGQSLSREATDLSTGALQKSSDRPPNPLEGKGGTPKYLLPPMEVAPEKRGRIATGNEATLAGQR